MGKRTDEKEKRRQQLLDTSLSLFVHKGYDGTTVRDIAQKADISIGLLFHYFPTKQAILEELIRLAESGISAMTSKLSASPDPLQSFEEIAAAILESFRVPTAKELFLLVNQIKTFESVSEIAQKLQSSDDNIQASVPVIIRGQKLGKIREGDPLALSIAYWGALQGIAEVLVWFPDSPIPDTQCILDILKSKADYPTNG